jgi:hypothetical protein
MSVSWEQIRNGIFAGESGGDYNAVFDFQNRPGGKFESVRLTEMPLSAVMEFTNPRGEYGQWVKGKIGRVATPVGAYQVVGTTLRAAVKALGLDPNTPFDEATQDRIGQWILANQGTGAWEGYRGPSNATPTVARGHAPRDRQDAPAVVSDPIIRLAFAYANGKMTPEDAALYEQGMAAGDFPKAEKKQARPDPLAALGETLSSQRQQTAASTQAVRRAPARPVDLNFMTRQPIARLPGI